MAQRQFRLDDTEKWKYRFGDGIHGSSYVVPSNEGISGTNSSGQKNLSLISAGSFSNGSLVLIHQTRGTDAGKWELNKIASGGGTTSLVMEHDLTNTYITSGNNAAQIIELKQYLNLVSGSITAPDWDGVKGGIVAWLDKNITTISGTINLSGKGFRGGAYSNYGSAGGSNTATAYWGEGTPAPNTTRSDAANGNGGGGGPTGGDWGTGGGGGGNGTAGTRVNNPDGRGGNGGNVVGTADLVVSDMGGGGGGGREKTNGGDSGSSTNGADGGGLLFVFAKEIIGTATITNNGLNAGNASGTNNGAGGGGAGGSILFKGEKINLSGMTITATGGSGGVGVAPGGSGGSGGVGRIAADYGKTVVGTTTPSIITRVDKSLLKKSGGSLLYNLM